MCDKLTADKHSLAVELLSLPEHIRGYDVVKEDHLARVKQLKQKLLLEFLAVTTVEEVALESA